MPPLPDLRRALAGADAALMARDARVSFAALAAGNPLSVQPATLDGAHVLIRTGNQLNAALAGAPASYLTPLGVAGPWPQRLPHFRADAVPANGNEIQTEFFVPMSQGAAALEAVRGLRKRLARVLLVSEIRAIAADDLWLSGASGRPTLALHFTWRHNAREVVGLLPGLQEALAPFSARPHWGTVWRRFSLNPLYPRLTHARDLFERLDPDGAFSNDHLQRIGVRATREP